MQSVHLFEHKAVENIFFHHVVRDFEDELFPVALISFMYFVKAIISRLEIYSCIDNLVTYRLLGGLKRTIVSFDFLGFHMDGLKFII